MCHKIIGAKPGEYFPMNVSIQGNYESIFSNYQNLRMFKPHQVTDMPRNVHQLLNVEIVVHIKADDEIVDKIYNNIINGKETFTLGRNEDLVRVEEIKYINKISMKNETINRYNAYIPDYIFEKEELTGINYRLNTTYTIENDLRRWNKVNVKFIERHTDNILDENVEADEDGDFMFFYKKD